MAARGWQATRYRLLTSGVLDRRDLQLVADLGLRTIERARAELQAVAGAPRPEHDSPRLDAMHQAPHALMLVEEDDVDRVAHEEHVDALRALDQQPLAGHDLGRGEQAYDAVAERSGDPGTIGDDRVPGRVADLDERAQRQFSESIGCR
jgi:hypothetical protein